jgi:hypothetical protein
MPGVPVEHLPNAHVAAEHIVCVQSKCAWKYASFYIEVHNAHNSAYEHTECMCIHKSCVSTFIRPHVHACPYADKIQTNICSVEHKYTAMSPYFGYSTYSSMMYVHTYTYIYTHININTLTYAHVH